MEKPGGTTYEIPITNDNNNNNNNQKESGLGYGDESGQGLGRPLGANNNNNNGGQSSSGFGGETGDPTIRIPKSDAEDKAINIVIKVRNNNNNNNNNDDPEGEVPSNNNNNGGGGPAQYGEPARRSNMREGDVCTCPRGNAAPSAIYGPTSNQNQYGQAMREMNAAGASLAAPTVAAPAPVVAPAPVIHVHAAPSVAAPAPVVHIHVAPTAIPAVIPTSKHGVVDPLGFVAAPVTVAPILGTTPNPLTVMPPNQLSTTTYHRDRHKTGAEGEVLTNRARKAIEFCQANVQTKGDIGDINSVMNACCGTKCASADDQFKCKTQCEDYFGHLFRKVLKAVTATSSEQTAKDVVF
jgi:hypothetical protein